MMRPDHCTLKAAEALDATTIARHRFPESAEDRAAYAGWVTGKLADGTYLGLFAVSDGEVVASAGLLLLDWGPTRGDPNPLRGRLVNVYTEPAFRRCGLARRLTVALLAEAQAQGLRSVGLSSTDAAHGLYEGLGFTARAREMLWQQPKPRPMP